MALSFHFNGRAGHAHVGRVAVFPGAWNPPTVAHAAIARAALAWASEIVWVLPRAFPHKDFDGAGFDRRLAMLTRLAASEPGHSVAVSDGGLYVEIADEARHHYGPAAEIGLLCGRDAAERIASWNYGREGVFNEMLERYPLLVAARSGSWRPAPEWEHRVVTLNAGAAFNEVSSSEVRVRIASGRPWEHLVPATIAGLVREAYPRAMSMH